MLFAIDIDQTIAGGNFRTYVEHHIQDLTLDIAPDVVESLTSYHDFLRLPQVILYRRSNEARFQESRASCRVSPSVILSLKDLPSAIAGVTTLSRLGTVRYYTIRAPETRVVTKQWLAAKQFPQPDDVIFCQDATDKLQKLYEQETNDCLVLIDDKCEIILDAFERMKKEKPMMVESLQQRLVLVAFGVKSDSIPAQKDSLTVLSLPTWEYISDVIAALGVQANS